MALTTATQNQLYQFFAIAFDAAPGVTYMSQLTDAVNAGMTVPDIVEVFTTKTQFTSVYPNFYTSNQFATKLIDNVVGNSAAATAKAAAVADVEAALTAGWSRGQVVYQIFSNLAAKPETDATWGNTAKMMANQVAVAKYVTETQLVDTVDLTTLKGFLANVTAASDVSTPAAIQAITGAATSAAIPGQTFTLTTAVGETVTGTAGNDTFKGYFDGNGASAGTYRDASTVNVTDAVVGGDGTDSLFLTIVDATGAAAGDTNTTATAAQAFAAGFSVSGVEKVTLVKADGTYINGESAANPSVAVVSSILNSATYAGVKELWQDIGAAGVAENVIVAADVAAGFKSTNAFATAVAATATVASASGTQSTLNVALDGIGHNSTLTFNGAGVKTISVSGTVAAASATNAGDLGLVQGTSIAETIKLSATSAVDLLTLNSFTTLKTLDASGTTGAIRANGTDGAVIANGTLTQLTSVKLGSGNDNVSFTLGGAKALTIDAGAGADTITLGGAAAADNLVTATLGAGKDTIVIGTTLANLGAGVDTDANLTARITTIADFNKAEDVINLAGPGVALTTAQLDAIKGQATLVAATTAAAAIAGNTGQVVFSWGNDAYVYTEIGSNGLSTADSLVKIVGLNAADLTNVQNGNLVL